jgi:hypothetical protein
MQFKTWAVRYVDENNGRTRQMEFTTEAARDKWIAKHDRHITVLAFSDPQ